MANTKSAIKRIRTSERRHQRNQAVKSATRTFVKKARTAITQNAGEAQDDVKAAISALDIAVRKGVIHRNNAARRKSRLMKRFNVAAAIAAAPAPEATAAAPARKSASRSGRKR
jgi:small subunit ribosomal protein S20